jgi:hypothetical protein
MTDKSSHVADTLDPHGRSRVSSPSSVREARALAQHWRGWIVGSSELRGRAAGPPGFQHLVIGGVPHIDATR